jgi:Domain of unknown function (DUF4266)
MTLDKNWNHRFLDSLPKHLNDLPVKINRFVIGIVTVFFISSCSPVKEYQKMHLNDSEMELATRKTQKFEMSFQLYREGASGANGGKTGGGCGCN